MKTIIGYLLIASLFMIYACNDKSGTVTDIDGNVYQTVKIGDQWWIAENLRVTRYRNGEQIHNIIDNIQWSNQRVGAWSYYGNDPRNLGTYGKLYNWYAVDNPKGLCPYGWRVPGDNDWNRLEIYLGMMQEDADKTGLRGIDVGNKLKSKRTEPDPLPRWNSPNKGATNESGFSGLPGGFRFHDGNYYDIGSSGRWWSSSEYVTNLGPFFAWYRDLDYSYSNIRRDIHVKQNGFSVRCLRDD